MLWVTFAAAEIGAVEMGTAEGVRELAERGHELHVQVPAPGPITELLDGVATIHVVPHNPWIVRQFGPTIRWAAYNALVATPKTVSLIDRLQPDVVVTETILYPTGAISARVRRTPHVWFVHALPQGEHSFPPLLLGKKVTLRAVGRLSAVVMCVSHAVLREASQWIPQDRMRVVRWAADVPSVEPEHRPNGSFRLILLGHKSPGKGQHEALRALAVLRQRGLDVELDLVGGGAREYESELRRLAAQLGVADYVRFIPHRQDRLALMKAADVALVCSRRDAFPRVPIEAMKLGVPVVAAADYGLLEAVQDGVTGLHYPPGDHVELAESVSTLMQDPAMARRLAENARTWACATFNRERYGDDLEDALKEAVRGRPGGRSHDDYGRRTRRA